MALVPLALGILLAVVLLAARVYAILPSRQSLKTRKSTRPSTSTCSLGVFLGSGGHTAEMKTLVSSLDFARYTPRTYVACHGDEMSLRAIAGLEAEKGGDVTSPVSCVPPHPYQLNLQSYDILLLPRARRVGQPLFSTALSTLKTILITLLHLFIRPLLRYPTKPWADVLIVNGPGTCVVLVLVSWIRRVLGLRHTKIIYVESFARVKSLSLSGKLVRPFVDTFVVQWPEAGSRGKNVEYRGCLV
jgi:beta-1,4-N-acetylglucosaminyltransferase